MNRILTYAFGVAQAFEKPPDGLRQTDPRRRVESIPKPVVSIAYGRQRFAAHSQRIQAQIEVCEGVIDRRQQMRLCRAAEFLEAPRQGVPFALELGRRPQAAPQSRT